MGAILDWTLRDKGFKILHSIKSGDKRNSARLPLWDVLTAYMLFMNGRKRCWVGMDRITDISCNGNLTMATLAKQWLLEHRAIVLVPHDKRVGAELELSPNHHVYQITGFFEFEGEIYPYLYLNIEDWQEISRNLSTIGVNTPLQNQVEQMNGVPRNFLNIQKVNFMNDNNVNVQNENISIENGYKDKEVTDVTSNPQGRLTSSNGTVFRPVKPLKQEGFKGHEADQGDSKPETGSVANGTSGTAGTAEAAGATGTDGNGAPKPPAVPAAKRAKRDTGTNTNTKPAPAPTGIQSGDTVSPQPTAPNADGLPETEETLRIKPALRPVVAAVHEAWKNPKGKYGFSITIAYMLAGVSKKAGWEEYNITPGLTQAQVRKFAIYYRRITAEQGLEVGNRLPTKPETIYRYVTEFLEYEQKQRELYEKKFQKAGDPLPKPLPVDPEVAEARALMAKKNHFHRQYWDMVAVGKVVHTDNSYKSYMTQNGVWI